MPIELYTGQPGNGKTALMMERLVEEAQRAERPIYACGIDGLQDGLATVLDDPRRWNEKDGAGEYLVPNGALIFVDEAWKWFGHLHDASRQQTPKHVLDLAEHRHRGLDFVWTTQQPNQLYPFVRGLIGAHSHVVRRFGTKMIDVFRWGELNEEIKSSAKRDLAQRTTRLLPSQIFGQYKSAEVHTIKPRIPWKVMALPALAIAAVLLGYLAYQMLKPSAMAESAGAKGAQSALADAPPKSSSQSDAKPNQPRWESATEYAKDHLPRIATMPWTAPIFDERSAVADPALVCMSTAAGLDGAGQYGEGGCTCLTEQGTAYDITEPECRTIARRGPVYNPYRERTDNRREFQQQQPVQAPAQAGTFAGGGSVVEKRVRPLGTFPESTPYQTDTVSAPTTREL